MWVFVAVAAVLAYFGHMYLNIRRRMYHFKKFPCIQPNVWSQVLYAIKKFTRKNKQKHDAGVYILQTIKKQNALHHRLGMNVFWVGLKPVVHIFSPELAEIVLNGSGSLNRSYDYEFLKKWFGNGIITRTGSEWRSRQRLLHPGFSKGILESFLPIFDEQARIFVANIDEQRRKKDDHIDIWPLANFCTLDVVCETVFGFRCGAQKGHHLDYLTANHNIEALVRQRINRPELQSDFLFGFSKIGRDFKRNMCVVENFAKKVVHHRMAGVVQRHGEEAELGGKRRRRALLDLLIDLHLDGSPITEQDIQTEVKFFLTAAQDTTAIGVAFVLFCLGLHPEVQRRLHDELDALFQKGDGRATTMEDVRGMKYMECVIKETLRLYPPVPITGRKPTKDFEHNGFVIPKCTDVYVNLMSLHQNPDSFPDPEVFDPDRFLPENVLKRHPYAYIPFVAAPRICMGHKYAMLEMKVIISNVLRRFRVVSLDPHIPLKLEVIAKPAVPVRLQFLPRTPS